MLTQTCQSRVWQEQSVKDIVDSVLADFSPRAYWQWSDDAISLIGQIPVRSYCVQHRETPLAFVSRILAEDGLSWRIDFNQPNAPDGHSMVLFADSTQTSACPNNPDNGATGLLFAGSSSQQQQDSIILLNERCSTQPALVTLTGYDYKSKANITASVPSNVRYGGKQHAQLPPVEHYDHPGQYAFVDQNDAERHATLIPSLTHQNKLIYKS